MILELRARELYYDTDNGLVYQVEQAESEDRACVSLFGPGHPEHRTETVATGEKDRLGRWTGLDHEEREHNEPFYVLVGASARRLAAWLTKQVAHPVTSRDGTPEGILDGYVRVYLDGERPAPPVLPTPPESRFPTRR